MIPRHLRITMLLLVVWGLIVVFFLPGITGRLSRLATWGDTGVEQQARREVTRPAPSVQPGAKAKVKLYWAGASGDSVEPTEIEMALSSTPKERAGQLLDALIARAPSEAQRTLPADTEVLATYVLGDGTALIDFSSAMGASLPSGIRSERVALDSITQTLAANLESVWRVKILIQGQEADTLAGHADLTGYFELRPPPAAAPALAAPEKPADGRPARASR